MSNANILLGVNIDHVATLRQARYRDADASLSELIEPDPVALALMAEQAGADGITVHPREDQRHIQRSDVFHLKNRIITRLNMEMAATDEMLAFALEIEPDSICLVPENREEVTTEGGLDVVANQNRVKSIVDTARQAGILTSLFIDPDPDQIAASAKAGASHIELHTGAYANAYYTDSRSAQFDRLVQGAAIGNDCGLIVNAGHGINYVNILEVREIPNLSELNIGHSIISRSVTFGLEEAVRAMKSLIIGD
ncbi:MAG TPA: pyridoxine 5'-phosphate synthase [Opitutae bacterium]|nr:pyridoxine 5'-phosphate synthase [Opitutaceae bacterium]HCR30437.1 pyridoxine 5'-phosphate synthase [Opitutae bacterium]